MILYIVYYFNALACVCEREIETYDWYHQVELTEIRICQDTINNIHRFL